MKKIIEVNQNMQSLEDLLGEIITIFCCNYIYTGELVGVNETYVELSNAKIVYETGELIAKHWKDAQSLPGNWWIMKSAMESWGKLNKQ